MHINTSRRGFLRGLAGASVLSATNCFAVGRGPGKIRLACVGAWGKGFSDWMPMVKSGLAEIVAICDADADVLGLIYSSEEFKALGIDLMKIPFYTDWRKLMDDAGMLGIQAMTISTPDHTHAAVAITAMKQGINVYVQKPLVRTLWELDYFNKTAKENNVVVQMGNQGSSLDSMRRCTEILQSGVIGDVTEVHVWTNRPVWPQGKCVADWVKGHPAGDKVPSTLNWDAWLGPAKNRPFLGDYGRDVKAYDPWDLGKKVYHRFTWRGFFDFGCGAFGDMACHTMNLPFRGLELGTVTDAECVKIEEQNDIAYPTKSIVKMTYAARESRVRKGVKLPAVTLLWYDGFDEKNPGHSGNKPSTEIMPKVVSTFGDVPDTGCYIIGSKGAVLMQDDYGAKCAIALNDEKKFVDCFAHEKAKAVSRSISFVADGSAANVDKSTVEMKGFAEGHYTEFLHAINSKGNYYDQTHSRCFSDIEYAIPQMEGILVGCIAQQVPGKIVWDAVARSFVKNDAANALVKPYIRDGWKF